MILFCACGYSDVIPVTRKRAAIEALRAEGADVRIVADLCGLAARRDPLLEMVAGEREVGIVACHPRAVRALFGWAGVELDMDRVRFVNLREVIDEPTAASGVIEAAQEWPSVDLAADWIPWFPVIDYARCVACRQCLDFCLFGVYEAGEDGVVRVVRPHGCKTNCPACARLCSEAAIMFPKYPDPPINGAKIVDEAAVRSASRALAEGDLRNALEARRARRRALLKPEYYSDDKSQETRDTR